MPTGALQWRLGRNAASMRAEVVRANNCVVAKIQHLSVAQQCDYFTELGRTGPKCRKAFDVWYAHRLRDVELQCLHNHRPCQNVDLLVPNTGAL